MVMSCAGPVQAAETGNPVTDFGDGGFTDEPSETPESTPEPTPEPQPTAAPEPTAVHLNTKKEALQITKNVK